MNSSNNFLILIDSRNNYSFNEKSETIIKYDDTFTFLDLKRKAEEIYGVDPKYSRIIYDGWQYFDERFIKDVIVRNYDNKFYCIYYAWGKTRESPDSYPVTMK